MGCKRFGQSGRFWGLTCLLLVSPIVEAREIHVNHQTGSDQNPGTAQAPLQSARRAVAMAEAGDVVHLLPENAVYREMITIADKRDITIEGHDCTVSGADPLPADPAQWESVGHELHRIRLRRTMQDRHILVVDGKAQTMGRTKYMLNPLATLIRQEGFEAFRNELAAQYPKPQDLQEGQFAWEPIDERSGWLYVKGPLDKLEWAVRSQGIYTEREVHNVTIRNLHARHALNDGFNIHGNAQNIRLEHVSGNECFDNGISPHGACSFSVDDSRFLRNEMAVGNDFLTETQFRRCTIGESVQEEIVILGGRHLFEDCTILATGPVAVRLGYSRPGPGRKMALEEIAASGKDQDMKPQYTFRRCTLQGVAGKPRGFVVGPDISVVIEKCALTGIEFQVDARAHVQVTDSTLDGRTLTEETMRRPRDGSFRGRPKGPIQP
ncbi:MAG: DUF1565 domain-containing protein [Pirellulaceae bacterium]|nr:DUF1565 domain-containing protein [Pirellulaceae bacterium]